MTTIARDSSNDIYLDGQNQIAVVSDTEAAVQIVDSRVKTVRGELLLNKKRGIPYFSTVLKHRKFLPYWENEMRNAILSCPGINAIKNFQYAVTDTELSYEAIIITNNSMAAMLTSTLGEND